MDREKELRVDPSEARARKQEMAGSVGRGPTMAIPPEPPAKDLPEPPAPTRPASASPIGNPSLPPNRPLPPRPITKSANSPKLPQPSRPPPLRPQAPLAMNPPTRPGTRSSQMSRGTAAPLRFPGSTMRLSWASIASRRPIKYAEGKHTRVELVPQPSDDPDDPLVTRPTSFLWNSC
jgi:hypothetical protein